MKTLFKHVGGVAVGVFAVCSTVLAGPIGNQVPEPGTLPLVGLAIVGALAVARFFKK